MKRALTGRWLLPRALLAAMVLVALPSAADAPRDPPQYDRFDGDSTIIKDLRTRVEWDRRAILEKKNLAEADLYCSALPSLPSGRLPSIKELLTILDEEPHNEYEFGKLVPKMIDALAFADTPVDLPYWSSSPTGTGSYWALSFKTGLMVPLADTAQANARCIR